MTQPLDPGLLLKAYAAGIFPMADGRDAPDVYWVEPRKRGILPLDGFKLSRSLTKTLRSGRFETTADQAFMDVVRLCAEQADDRPSTWINHQIEASVMLLHAGGRAHSVETWEAGRLVGGLYGVKLGRAFFGESMFSRATDSSKVALAHLVARLRAGGFTLLDCQFITPHLASLGAIEIDRADYLAALMSAVAGAAAGAGGALVPGSTAASGDFAALDRLFEAETSPRRTIVSGPTSGCFIAQALVQTS
ncbi:MAG: leucyl/phenylalanyl-tRNA--protein transferase [Sphingomonadales bacterium]|nr:leucyl/phenylalanyl-tRNA--protein transferase [Sphingomonadales bacterium]MBK6720035.1 leucyl/phenylalanyl-tRNA--protein transferase [Sphingomonadales bacterium]MBK8271542.1 leucyl/phenylalanyl-tRNA--protein transferase [Sphingomonadales bacterium]MBK8861576.1 leucyl/phenylalanyl-tRNA--protein transferase [Sphingomonadales bacterium]